MIDFTTWMLTVDQLLVNKYDMSSAEMIDYTWWDAWDGGSTPAEAIEDAEYYWEFEA